MRDASQGVLLGRTFNTAHSSIVNMIGGNQDDYIAVIVENGQLGIDRVNNRGMTPDQKRELAIYAVRVLLAEGANPNWKFYFRDQYRQETAYTLSDVAEGKLDQIISPYAMLTEFVLDEPLLFTANTHNEVKTGFIYFTRRPNSLEIVVPNEKFVGLQRVASNLIRSDYSPKMTIRVKIGTGENERIIESSLGELAGIAKDFVFVVGDKFIVTKNGETQDLLVTHIDDGKLTLTRENGEIVDLSRNEINARLLSKEYEFLVPSPLISYRVISPTFSAPSLQLAQAINTEANRKPFIGIITKDGRFIWTTQT